MYPDEDEGNDKGRQHELQHRRSPVWGVRRYQIETPKPGRRLKGNRLDL